MSERHEEVEAWLGPALDDMTADQVDRFVALVGQVDRRYPTVADDGQDHAGREARAAARSGAHRVLVGDDTLDDVARVWQATRRAEREAMATLTGAIIAEADVGTPETAIAARAGLARASVRKALGK